MKFCVDCKHYDEAYVPCAGISGPIYSRPTHKCRHPNRFTTSVVTGEQETNMIYCLNAREIESDCGKEAKWFEEKPIGPVEPRKKLFGFL